MIHFGTSSWESKGNVEVNNRCPLITPLISTTCGVNGVILEKNPLGTFLAGSIEALSFIKALCQGSKATSSEKVTTHPDIAHPETAIPQQRQL